MPAPREVASERLVIGASREVAASYFIDEIKHYMYGGDTALHIVAAAYRTALVRELVAVGAAVDAANRRRQQPLHYAVDQGGVTPLHRAVRNRCAAAVQTLLERGADARRKNANGSTPAQLATLTTGRGGAGMPAAKAQQAELVQMLAARG